MERRRTWRRFRRGRPPRVQVVVAGFNRCLSKTFESIEDNVIAPLMRNASHVEVTYVISRTREMIVNSWSGEAGSSEYDLPKGLVADTVITLEQEEVDSSVTELLDWGKANLPSSEARTMKNLIRYLFVLDHARRYLSSDADFIVHLRPDLVYLDPWEMEIVAPARLWNWISRGRGVRTPSWGYQPNDRFAVLGAKSAPLYFGRISRLRDYANTTNRFSPEGLLEFSVRGQRLAANLPFRAARVRIDGLVKSERFGQKRYFNKKLRVYLRGFMRKSRKILDGFARD